MNRLSIWTGDFCTYYRELRTIEYTYYREMTVHACGPVDKSEGMQGQLGVHRKFRMALMTSVPLPPAQRSIDSSIMMLFKGMLSGHARTVQRFTRDERPSAECNLQLGILHARLITWALSLLFRLLPFGAGIQCTFTFSFCVCELTDQSILQNLPSFKIRSVWF